ncbi:unnamed protein product [Rhodiola kirilowii]
MYVTRRITDCRRHPELLDAAPPEGPFSGVMVIHDQEAEEAKSSCCFGLCIDTSVKELPLPQNKTIIISFTSGSSSNNTQTTSNDYVMLFPVLGQPLSSNTYYAVQANGKHQGEAHTSSTEEDMKTCCFCTCIGDVKPRPLDPNNPLQQFQLFLRPPACSAHQGFKSKSVSPGAFPPYFLRRKGWTVYAEISKDFTLGEALGLDAALRSRFPGFEFSLSSKTSAHVGVGKWYVPFMFVKEGGMGLKEQMKKSTFYEMTLEQRWEKIFDSENAGRKTSVVVDATVVTEVVLSGGRVSMTGSAADGVMWYKSTSDAAEIGLSLGIVDRMKWEEKRVGWNEGGGKIMVEAIEELSGSSRGEWSRFGCYVLVERFELKRMDGSLVISFDFYHTHQTRNKWE